MEWRSMTCFRSPLLLICSRCGLRNAVPEQRHCTACLELEHRLSVERFRARLAFEEREREYLDSLATAVASSEEQP